MTIYQQVSQAEASQLAAEADEFNATPHVWGSAGVVNTTTTDASGETTTRLYREGVFIGRVTGQAVYDCTGRLRCGDEFEQFVLEGKCD